MPSSISSSDAAASLSAAESARPGFVRLTASDRPGIAQPVPERDIPAQPWGRIALLALLGFVLLMAGWEMVWRDYGATPSYRNSNGEWARQRRRIDQGEGGKTVLTGSSRVMFDVQLPAWEKITGERPIQLAIEGTSPVPIVEDLAKDKNFTGRLLIGVAPDIFFTGFNYRGEVLPYYHKESPSQRGGNWLSMNFIEPYFAFDDPDFSLTTVVRRQAWPPRPGLHAPIRVRKLAVSEADRNTHMWRKVETDAEYRAMAQAIWASRFAKLPPGLDTAEGRRKSVDEQIGKAAAAVATLRARGVPVLFVRMPSIGPYYAFEEKNFARGETWDRLLVRTGAPGIHFMDHAQLQGYNLPEWSHLSASEATRFTLQFVPLVQAAFASQAAAFPTVNGQGKPACIPFRTAEDCARHQKVAAVQRR